jgi:uncharacterized protein YndB with AHSA1/START domain
MIEIVQQINAVHRQVGERELPTGEGRTVTISRTYDTPIDDLWDACTNSQRIPRWFLPISGDLRVGGHYQLEGNAGGTIERCDPPNSFAATWEFGGSVSWIQLQLTSEPGGGTRFDLEHTMPVDDRWNEFGPGAVGVGWDGMLMGLSTHLESGQAVDAAEAAAWATSEEGKKFMALSSQGWCEAYIAAGADEADAKAAADRTTAAYTAG